MDRRPLTRTGTLLLGLALLAMVLTPLAWAIDPPVSPTQGTLNDPCVTVAGHVRNENGFGIDGITVIARAQGFTNTLVYDGDETDEDGAFTLQLSTDTWDLYVEDQAGNWAPLQSEVAYTTCGTKALELTMAPMIAAANAARGTLLVNLVDDLDGDGTDDLALHPLEDIEVRLYQSCQLAGTSVVLIGLLTSGLTDAAGDVDLVVPAAQGPGALASYCIRIAMGTTFIDDGAGSVTDGVFIQNGAVAITADATTAFDKAFVRKTRNMDITVSDFNVAGGVVDGATLVLTHPIFCPNGEPPEVADRYTCVGTTSSTGALRFTVPLDAGTPYRIDASHPGFFDRSRTCELINSPTSGSNGNTPATQTVQSCPLTMSHAARALFGRVMDGATPVVGATVTVDGRRDLDDRVASTDSNGRFAMSVRSDDYTVAISSGTQTVIRCVTVAGIGRDLGDVALGVPGTALHGKATDAHDAAHAGIGGVLVRMVDASGDTCHTRTASDGSYSVAVPAGTMYSVILGDPLVASFPYLTSVLVPTAPGDRGETQLARKTGTISLVVREDAATSDVALVGVKVVCSSTTTTFTGEGFTETGGTLNLVVPFGSNYRCHANDTAQNLANSTQSAALTVTVGDSTATVNLLMQRVYFVLEGRVTDITTDRPIHNVSVDGLNVNCLLGGSQCQSNVKTDVDGNYTLRIKLHPSGFGLPRANAIHVSYTHAQYVPLHVAGLVGADVPTPAINAIAADRELIPQDPSGGAAPPTPDSVLCETENPEDPADGSCDEGVYSPPGSPTPPGTDAVLCAAEALDSSFPGTCTVDAEGNPVYAPPANEHDVLCGIEAAHGEFPGECIVNGDGDTVYQPPATPTPSPAEVLCMIEAADGSFPGTCSVDGDGNAVYAPPANEHDVLCGIEAAHAEFPGECVVNGDGDTVYQPPATPTPSPAGVLCMIEAADGSFPGTCSVDGDGNAVYAPPQNEHDVLCGIKTAHPEFPGQCAVNGDGDMVYQPPATPSSDAVLCTLEAADGSFPGTCTVDEEGNPIYAPPANEHDVLCGIETAHDEFPGECVVNGDGDTVYQPPAAPSSGALAPALGTSSKLATVPTAVPRL